MLRMPELFLLLSFPTAKAVGVVFGIQGHRLTQPGWKINAPPLPNPPPIRAPWGEGIKALDGD